jgi:hypothetical protein
MGTQPFLIHLWALYSENGQGSEYT